MPTADPPLSPEKWARLREIHAKVLEAPQEQQSGLLELLCGDDTEIRVEMNGLFSAARNAGSFLEENASVAFDHLVSPPTQELSTGTVLDSRFHILRYIDRGGMGAVYEAWDAELQEAVALKTIRPEIASHQSIIERFKQEVRQAHHVTHPNICRVNDLFSHDFSPGHRLWFFTMQLLKGETLGQRLRRSGPLQHDEALEVVRQIISGLSEAHRHGVIHRDFKSANVMLTEDGDRVRALIMDFGLACEATTGRLGGKEHPGQGTPAYTAPEQWFEGTATPSSDQYSLGVVMCEMLTGERPDPVARESESFLPLRLPASKNLDRHWEGAICRCLERRPENRFHSLEDILKSIDPAHRRKLVLSSGAGALAFALVAAIAVLIFSHVLRLPVMAGRKPASREGIALSQGPRLSRDGKTLVYVSDQERSGRLDVFRYPLPRGPARRITIATNPEVEIKERPAISPDGNWIAFETAQRPAGVYLASVHDGAATLIAANGHEPSFSPDGKWMLYATSGDEFVVSPDGRIFVYSLAARTSTRLATHMADARIPLWNSDGDHILFTGCEAQPKIPYPDCKDWWVASLKGEIKDPSAMAYSGPRVTGAAAALASEGLKPPQYFAGWQDDTVVFSARRGDSPVVGVWKIRLNLSETRVDGKPVQLMRGDSRDFIISSSISGNTIATCEWHPSVNVWRIDQAQSSARTETSVTSDPDFDMSPSVSRNGRWLIFTRGFTDARGIYVMDTWDKNNPPPSHPEFQDTAINSPIIDDTGKLIAFEATDKTGPVIRISVDGKEQKKPLCSNCRDPRGWIDPGSSILYSDSALSEIRVQDISEDKPTTILSAPLKQVQDATWSQENGYIAFTVLKQVRQGEDQRTVQQIFAAPYVAAHIPEESWIQVTDEADYSRKPQWSGDGKYMYYLSKRDGYWCVWGQGFDLANGRLSLSGPAFPVRHYHDPKSTPGSINASGLNLAVAGDQVYLNVLETEGTIYVGKLAHPGLFSREY